MGWTFDWLSSADNDFNYDYAVSFTPEEIKSGAKRYNFGTSGFSVEDAPGISVFYRDEAGNIFHTYSCFARGLDMMNAAYHYLDLTPLGRHEEGLPYPMDWVRLRDQYQPAPVQASCCIAAARLARHCGEKHQSDEFAARRYVRMTATGRNTHGLCRWIYRRSAEEEHRGLPQLGEEGG